MKKINKYIFLLSLAVYIFLLFYKSPLPKPDAVSDEIRNSEPKQTEIKNARDIVVDVGQYVYKLTPLYDYELKGLVVSQYASENWLDVRHENDPGNIKDLCIVWGENVTNGSYREVKFSSGEFTCFWRWDRKLEKPFDGTKGSNNHLIPANKEIADKIRKTGKGDQVRIRGVLANYEVYKDGLKVFTRNTSVARDDTGNGACEIIYVTDYEVIQKNKFDFSAYKSPAKYTALTSGVLGIISTLIN